jgi:hypothetical protein
VEYAGASREQGAEERDAFAASHGEDCDRLVCAAHIEGARAYWTQVPKSLRGTKRCWKRTEILQARFFCAEQLDLFAEAHAAAKAVLPCPGFSHP